MRPAAWRTSPHAAILETGERQQQVLDAHELILHALGLGLGRGQDLVHTRREVDLSPLSARPRDPWQSAERLPQPLHERRRVGAGLLHDARRDAAILLEQGHHEMLGLDLRLSLALRHALRLAHRVLRLLGQPVGIHACLSLLFRVAASKMRATTARIPSMELTWEATVPRWAWAQHQSNFKN